MTKYLNTVNVYGDYIYNLGLNKINLDELDRDSSVIVKSNLKYEDTDTFKFLVEDRGVYFYGNILAQKIFPHLFDGKIVSINVTIVINNKFVLGVKDTSRPLITLINGQRESGETAEQCAIREIQEETGIQQNEITSILETNVTSYSKEQYGHKFRAQSHSFVVHVTLDKLRLRKINSHTNEEIDKVILIQINHIPQPDKRRKHRKAGKLWWSPTHIKIMMENINFIKS